MPEWVPSTDFEDDILTIQPEPECDESFRDYATDLGASLFDPFKNNHTKKEIPDLYPEVNNVQTDSYNNCSSGSPTVEPMILQDLEEIDTAEYEILGMIRRYGMGPSADENLNSVQTIPAISSCRPYAIAGFPILFDEAFFKLEARKSISSGSSFNSNNSYSSDSHEVGNDKEERAPDMRAALGHDLATVIKPNKIDPFPCHHNAMNSKPARKITTQTPIPRANCIMSKPSTDFDDNMTRTSNFKYVKSFLTDCSSHEVLKVEDGTPPNIPSAALNQNPPSIIKPKNISLLTCLPKLINTSNRLILKPIRKIITQNPIPQTIYTMPDLVPSTQFGDDKKELKPGKSISIVSCSKYSKSSPADCSSHEVSKIEVEAEPNIWFAARGSNPTSVVKRSKIGSTPCLSGAMSSVDRLSSKLRREISTQSQAPHKKSAEWVPSLDFDDVFPVQPENENYAKSFGEPVFDSVKTNHMNMEKNYEVPNLSRKVIIGHKIKYNTESSEPPDRRQITPQDLDENDTTECEILAMIREQGMTSSVDENLSSARTIPGILSNRSYVKSAIPILYDEAFFKLKPRKSISSASGHKFELSSSTDYSSHKVSKDEKEPVTNISCVTRRQNPAVLKPNELYSLPSQLTAMNSDDKPTKPERKIAIKSPVSQMICTVSELVPCTDFEDDRIKSKHHNSSSRYDKQFSMDCSSQEVAKVEERATPDISCAVFQQNSVFFVKPIKNDILPCLTKLTNNADRQNSTPDKSSSTDCSSQEASKIEKGLAQYMSCTALGPNFVSIVKPNKIDPIPCIPISINKADRLSSEPIREISTQSPIPHTMSAEWVPSLDFQNDIVSCDTKCEDYADNFSELIFNPVKMNRIEWKYENRNLYQTINIGDEIECNNGPSKLPIGRQMIPKNLDENDTTEYEILSMIRGQGMTPSVDWNLNSTRTIPVILSDRPYAKSLFPILYDESFFKLKPRKTTSSAYGSQSEMLSSTVCCSHISCTGRGAKCTSILRENQIISLSCLQKSINNGDGITLNQDQSSSTNCPPHEVSKVKEGIGPNISFAVLRQDPGSVVKPIKIDPMQCFPKAMNSPDRISTKPSSKIEKQGQIPRTICSIFELGHSTNFESDNTNYLPRKSISKASDSKYDKSPTTNCSSYEDGLASDMCTVLAQKPVAVVKPIQIDTLSCVLKPVNSADTRNSNIDKLSSTDFASHDVCKVEEVNASIISSAAFRPNPATVMKPNKMNPILCLPKVTNSVDKLNISQLDKSSTDFLSFKASKNYEETAPRTKRKRKRQRTKENPGAVFGQDPLYLVKQNEIDSLSCLPKPMIIMITGALQNRISRLQLIAYLTMFPMINLHRIYRALHLYRILYLLRN